MQNTNSPLWIATGNLSKAKELTHFANLVLPEMISVTCRGPRDVDENQPTFQGNAELKARALVEELLSEGHKDFWVLGDDSGLCVDLLDGRPGVHSARFALPSPNPQRNLEKLLNDLEAISLDLEKRSGRYLCALCLICVSDGRVKKTFFSEGVRDGLIGLRPTGLNGYAYDSVFLNPKTLKSYGEVSYEEKQIDSHRHRAFEKLREQIQL